MRDANRQPHEDQPTRPIRRGPSPATHRSVRFIAEAKDGLNVPPLVMNDTSRNSALAEDLRLAFLGLGPATNRSARFAATSIEGLNVPRLVEMHVIKPTDPGLNQGATVPSDSVVSGADVVSDEEDWEKARPVPDLDIGTPEKDSLTTRPLKNGGRNLFKSLGRNGV